MRNIYILAQKFFFHLSTITQNFVHCRLNFHHFKLDETIFIFIFKFLNVELDILFYLLFK